MDGSSLLIGALGALVVVAVVAALAAVVDILRTPGLKGEKKAAWCVVAIAAPLVGAFLWFTEGRDFKQ